MNLLSKLKMNYYDTHQSGETITKINNDIANVSTLFTQLLPKAINYGITFIGILTLMFTINVSLTLITLAILPITIFLSKFIIKAARKKYQLFYTNHGKLNSIIEESYRTKEIISLYNNSEIIGDNFNKLNKDLAKISLKASLITNLINPLSSLINYSIYIIIILVGSNLVLNNKMNIGDIYTFIQYSKQ